MTREEAVKILKSIKEEFDCPYDIEALEIAIEALQKEPCEDAISRKLVLSTVKSGLIRIIDGEKWKRVMDNVEEVRKLPPVQPAVCIAKLSFDDQQMKEMVDKAISNLEFPDCISRTKAIEWVKRECNPDGDPTLDFESGRKVIEYLSKMSSAKPVVIPADKEKNNE